MLNIKTTSALAIVLLNATIVSFMPKSEIVNQAIVDSKYCLLPKTSQNKKLADLPVIAEKQPVAIEPTNVCPANTCSGNTFYYCNKDCRRCFKNKCSCSCCGCQQHVSLKSLRRTVVVTSYCIR